jgi:glucose-6-phosphate 1-dehydrogenase
MGPLCKVIYAGSGEMTTRKLLPTLFGLYQEGYLPEQFAVVGVGLSSLSNDSYRGIMSVACRAALGDLLVREAGILRPAALFGRRRIR